MPETDHPCLSGPGVARAALRAVDWAENPLGPPQGWPIALQVAVQMMLASAFPKAIFWGPAMVTMHNDAFAPILGAKPPAQGRRFDDIWAEAWSEIGGIAALAYDGEATFIEDFPLTITRNGYPELCNFTFCYSPIRDENGRVGGVMDTVIETTGKVEAERALRLRNAELAHRLKNTLAVVSVIARQTLRAAESTEDAWVRLSARLGALGAAHHILTSGAQVAAPASELIATALGLQGGAVAERVTTEGPEVVLDAKQALAVALVINELATNAIKYGALSVPEGAVAVVWRRGADARGATFALDWTERGGPVVSASGRKGFGSLLLERVAPQDFAGTARITIDPEGLSYRLSGWLDH